VSTSHITEHFTWAEAACHSGADVPLELQPNARRLAELLEDIREKWGGPVAIVSWYRTPWHNKVVGGADQSQHLKALAADIRPGEGMDAFGRFRMCIEGWIESGELPTLGGYGVYPAWLHVDCRQKPENGHIARWWGRGIGSEP